MKNKWIVYWIYITLAIRSKCQLSDCEKIPNTTAAFDVCTSIKQNDPMKFCCFVSYIEKEGEVNRARCKLLENTRFAIEFYKDTLDNIKKLKINCSAIFFKPFVTKSNLIIGIIMLILFI